MTGNAESRRPSTRVFTGLDLAERINAESRRIAGELGREPHCVVFADRACPAVRAYCARLEATAGRAGVRLRILPYADTEGAIREQVTAATDDPAVDAATLLLPIPHLRDGFEAALWLGPQKDADGLHPANMGELAAGRPTRPPATAMACLLCARELFPSLRGLEIVLVGASRIVGRPLAALLLDEGATVTLCHAETRDLAAHTRAADLVISAAGVPGLLGADHVKDGAVLLDVAVTQRNGELRGDVDRAAVEGKASVVSHVPDGIGPVTTACLFRNVVTAAAERRQGGGQS